MQENINAEGETRKIFGEYKNSFLEYVNRKFLERPDLEDLIGGIRNVQLMLDNHRNHISFISILLKIGNIELLEKTIPWVYHSYHNQGFSYDYFSAVLAMWKESFEQVAFEYELKSLKTLYGKMISDHGKNIAAAENYKPYWEMETLTEEQQELVRSLITGDQRNVMAITDRFFIEGGHLEDFYKFLITPAMYAIGGLWESGRISVAEEHLASSIISRIMAANYSRTDLPEPEKGKIVICSSANEYHELGAWMTANLFEKAGWDVNYLGANTPVNDLESLLLKFRPKLLGLSVTMAFNLETVEAIISRIRENPELNNIKIILGGNIFSMIPELKLYSSADFVADTIENAINFASTVE